MNVLILGVSGMLGHTLFKELSRNKGLNVSGSVRKLKDDFAKNIGSKNVIANVDCHNLDSIRGVIESTKSEVVINCIGVIKQLESSNEPVEVIKINTLFPHELAKECSLRGAKLIHFSTDCVFDGIKGNYTEIDIPNALDLYGRSKALGEVDYSGHLTLRTSIIGHELTSQHSLIDWFLSQNESIGGYDKAIFSGLPTIEVARFISQYVLPNTELSGLYHLSVNPISKYELLNLVKTTYKKQIKIIKNDIFEINRSLSSEKLIKETGFVVKPWPQLVREMHEDYIIA